ncbi:MAG: hypothetical protein ACPL0B_00710 [Anaerolineales bacterium]
MKIITNEKKKKLNRRIALGATLAGMAVLIGGLLLSIKFPTQVGYSFGALIVGFILAQIGMYFTNRWGRNPSPDELLNQSLKGLDQSYTICHYYTPVYHLLVGPAGIWILALVHVGGTITFQKGRWIHKGASLLRLFGQEGLGRPDLELPYEIEKVQKFLKPIFGEEKSAPVKAALILTNPKVKVEIGEDENPPAATIELDKLKEFIRKEAKRKPISLEKVESVNQFLEQFQSP